MARLLDGITDLFARTPHALIALIGRLSLGWIFWSTARIRVDGSWNLLEPRGSTLAMLRGTPDIPYLPPGVGAVAFQLAEHALPVLLAVGLASRFAALGLLVLTLIFQLFVQPGAMALHGTWAAVLLMILKYGPGSLSIDEGLGRR
jgi:putative oxidoreductase